MKVQITTQTTKEIEVPEYFESSTGRFCKILSDKYMMVVCSNEFDEVLDLEPSIHIQSVGFYLDRELKEITKDKFDLEFIKAEKMLNELRNR